MLAFVVRSAPTGDPSVVSALRGLDDRRCIPQLVLGPNFDQLEFRDGRLALIVLDASDAGASLSWLPRLAALGAPAPVIVVLAEERPMQASAARRAGASDVLTLAEATSQPILRRAVDYALALRDLRAEARHREIWLRSAARRFAAAPEIFSAVVRGAPVAIITMDLAHRITSWNLAAERIFEWNEAEILGRPYPLLPEGREAEFDAIVARSLRGEATVEFETQRARKDGALIDVAISGGSIRTSGGGVELIGFFTDISERRRAYQELEESRRLLAEAQRIANVGSWSWDIAQNRLVWSDELLRIFGLDRGEFGATYEAFVARVHPADRERVKATVERAVREKESYGLEIRIVRPDGEIRTLQAHGEVFTDSSGRVERLAGAVVDVTENRRAQDVIRTSREQLRALNSRLEKVRAEERLEVARELHDQLGQELSSLKLQLTAYLRRLAGDGDDARRDATPILAVIDQSMQTVRRLATQLRSPVLESVGLGPAIEALVADFRRRTGSRVDLACAVDGWQVDLEVARATHSILQEGLENVWRHADATLVEVTLSRREDDLVMTVRDNGRGITVAESRSVGALGVLGMRERVLALGGSIAIEGEPGRGTLLHVILPGGPRPLSGAAS